MQSIHHKTLIIGISSDILCPVEEQMFMAENMPNASYFEITSAYGHDGFLVEVEKITEHVSSWLAKKGS